MAKLVGEKKENSIDKKEVLNTHYSGSTGVFMFVLVSLAMGIFYLIGKNHFFSGYSTLKDFIIEESAISGLNKTGEWNFFWLLLVLGCILCVLSALWTIFCINPKKKEEGTLKCYVACLPIFLPAIIKTVVYGEGVLYLWLFSIVLYICLALFERNGKEFAAYFLFVYFDFQFFSFMVSRFKNLPKHSDFLIFIATTFVLVIALLCEKYAKKNDSVFKACFLATQFPLPLLLLVYTKVEYSIGNTIKYFPYPVSYLIFIFGVIFTLYAGIILEYFYFVKKKPNANHPNIYLSSAISIFLFTSYLPGVMAVQSDMHHHGEQMLPWQQIINLGNKAYVDYYPVSGLFSMLIGGLNQLFFGNKATTYAISFIILFVLFAVLTILTIRLSVDAYWTLLFAFIFQMPAYCRTWMLLPALLLMLYATKKKNFRPFLYVYIFTSFLAGLYYPLFGVALVLAGMPHVVGQIVAIIKNHEVKNRLQIECKNKWFYISTIFVFIPILISIPLLIAMAKHILTYQEQTLLADGLPLLASELPSWFMAWGKNVEKLSHLRNTSYFGLRFLGPMIPVWMVLLLLCRYFANKKNQKTSNESYDTSLFFGLTASVLTLVMSYRYTVVIQDENWVSHLFSRSSHVLLWIVGIFVPILLIKYGKELLDEHYRYVLVSFCISFIMICFVNMKDYQFPVLDGATNLSANVIGEYCSNYEPYKLSENLTLISDQDKKEFPNLGDGFIDIQVLSNLYSYKGTIEELKKYDPDLNILGLNGNQMYYFLLNENAVYSGKPSLAKSKKAADMVKPFINEHLIVGADIKPFYNYYIYKELKKQGFIYEERSGFYISKELYIKLYGEEMYEASLDAASPWSDNIYIVKTASTLDASMRYLYERLEPMDMTKGNEEVEFCQVNIPKENMAEYFGCEITEDTYISITWDDQVRMVLDFDNGEWLLPFGVNSSYDTVNIEDVYIGIYDGGNGCEIINARLVDVSDNMICYRMKK